MSSKKNSKYGDLDYIIFSGIDVKLARENGELFPVDAMRIKANLEGLTVSQYFMNENIKKMTNIGWLLVQCQLSRFKCAFCKFLPCSVLEVRDKLVFEGWKIRHCLNCDADPYDSEAVAWDAKWHNDFVRCYGALIRCKRCGQLRWRSQNSDYEF